MLHIEKYQLTKWDIAVAIGVMLYAIIFSYLLLYRLSIFQLEFDLAIFNQAFWTTTHTGGIFENSIEGRSHFGTHFSPILIILLPFYYLVSGPVTLLVAQSVLLSLGAVPIYLCARKLIDEKVGCIIAFIYLLYPALHGITLYDFHEVAFLPVLLGFALYFLLTGKRNICLVFCLLCMCIKEDVSLIVIMIGLIGLIMNRTIDYKKNWQYIVLIILPIILLFFWFVVIKPAFCFGDVNAGSQFLDQYSDLSANFSDNNNYRWSYLIMIFAPLLCLPFAAPLIFSISIPSFMEILFSPISYYYSINYQYSALIIPVLFMAVIKVFQKLQNGTLIRKKIVMPLLVLTLISTIICTSLFSPALIPLKLINAGYQDTISGHNSNVIELTDVIPENASVSTQLNLLPFVSERKTLYSDYSSNADVILIDSYSKRSNDFNDNIDSIKDQFKTVLDGDGIYLFVKNDKPELIDEISENLKQLSFVKIAS